MGDPDMDMSWRPPFDNGPFPWHEMGTTGIVFASVFGLVDALLETWGMLFPTIFAHSPDPFEFMHLWFVLAVIGGFAAVIRSKRKPDGSVEKLASRMWFMWPVNVGGLYGFFLILTDWGTDKIGMWHWWPALMLLGWLLTLIYEPQTERAMRVWLEMIIRRYKRSPREE